MPNAHIFTAITSEGGILPADFLAALTAPKSDIEGLDPVTYRLAPGERVGDQVNRSWNRLKGCWVNFQRSIAAKQPGEPTTTETRERWLYPLFHELDFGRLAVARPIEHDGKSYPVSHGWGPVPIHLVGTHVDLDKRTPGAVGAAKASPHSLVQQVLNASDGHLWGVISNGFTLRLLRDNVALTRMAYVEWDLQAIFDGDLYPEFFLLWLVCHQSRFEAPPDGRTNQSWIEKWKKQAEEKGLRALENLRPGVKKAIASIGAGLVSHKVNQALRSKLSSGQLTTQDFYRQILRIIYRMLFLFVAEDRGLMHPPLPGEDAGKDAIEGAIRARKRYRDFYSMGRLRDLTLHRAGTPHPDLWQVFQLISGFLGSDSGCPELAVPPLGSFLWSSEATPDLNDCLISNRHFLEAVLALGFIRDENVRRAIDYKNLGSEELGSVYESLLELHPIVNADAGTFELMSAPGHERKTTGSYYTHDSLVQCLLDSALEPVIAETMKGKEGSAAADSLLKLKIYDPAVGSGHFLISAAHRLARRVAAARTGEEEPSPEATRSALREVIGHCLYGVDVNPMAAELFRVSLWLEALEPGKPLSFLDHHIRVGNSLLGATPELINAGLPDEAFNPIEGDDKKVCSALKKQNKRESAGQRDMLHLMVAESQTEYNSIESQIRGIDEAPDGTIDEIHRKADQFHRLVVSPEYRHTQQIADAWCAAFVWRKQANAPFQPITFDTIRRLEEDPNSLTPGQKAEVERLSRQYLFFHWHLAFPEVFARGGFDCVLGNPPWERVKLQEKEWFAERNPEIANAPNAAVRKRMIEALKDEAPDLYRQFLDDLRRAEGESHLLRHSGRYPLCGRGDINTYAVFAENMRQRSCPTGRIGCIVPSGIATDDTTKFFIQDVLESESLFSLFDFQNSKGLFPEVDRNFKFCLLTLAGNCVKMAGSEFVCAASSVEDLFDENRRYTLNHNDFHLLNPNTLTCPVFRSRREVELTKEVYRRLPVLVEEGPPEKNPWDITFTRMFDMTNDAHVFKAHPDLEHDGWALLGNVFQKSTSRYLPLYEAKMLHQYDHRFAHSEEPIRGQRIRGSSVAITDEDRQNAQLCALPRYWVDESEVKKRLPSARWSLVFRDIGGAVANIRTVVACVLGNVGIGNKAPVIVFRSGSAISCAALLSSMNSFAFDFFARQKVTGVSLNYFILKQLPVPAPSMLENLCGWASSGKNHAEWVLPRVLELTYTAWDLEPFAQDCGWSGPPFRWDEERRFLLRCELDAAFFHLYLGSEDEWRRQPESLTGYFPTPRHAVDYIMDTFPIVKRKDEEKHGEYRTKRVILEIYDEMAEAMRTGIPYKTRLTPSPGPPADEHGNFLPLPEWKPGQPKPPNWPSHIHLPKVK